MVNEVFPPSYESIAADEEEAESPVEAEKPAEAEKPTRGGRRKAPEPKEETPARRTEKEHLGRRRWMQWSMAKKATSENKVEDVDLVLEVAAGGSSTKALDPCLETGEVGEGPARPAKEPLGRRGWIQCQSKEKGPR